MNVTATATDQIKSDRSTKTILVTGATLQITGVWFADAVKAKDLDKIVASYERGQRLVHAAE